MKLFFALAAVALTLSTAGTALAFSVDTTATTRTDNSAQFSNPEDKIAFPHFGDDGKPVDNFQPQPQANQGPVFSLNPTPPEPDAFQRVQERVQQ